MEDKRKVILDCDTGSDDSVAIMMAALSDKIDLLGICTVAGNKGLELTTENTLAVVEALGMDIPVYAGCREPMVANLLPNRHGKYNGMTGVAPEKVNEKGEVIVYHTDRLPLPLPTTKPQPEHAVFWLIRTLMESQGDITLVPTGPLTNIAMALRIAPEISTKIKEIVFMGGGFKVFNATCASEFNIWKDPEAAQIVLTAGIPVVMVPLDATHQSNLTREDCQKLREIGSACTCCVADILEMRITAYDAYQPQQIPGSAPLHDALALAYVIDPEVLQDIRFFRVDVDISGGFADGQTICDTRTYPDRPRNCHVALGADRERFLAMVYELLGKTAG